MKKVFALVLSIIMPASAGFFSMEMENGKLKMENGKRKGRTRDRK